MPGGRPGRLPGPARPGLAPGLKFAPTPVDPSGMKGSRETLCFTCGQAVQQPPRFNLLETGEHCPTCRDRVLDAVPPLLPRFGADRVEEESGLQMGFAFDDGDDADDYPDPPLSA